MKLIVDRRDLTLDDLAHLFGGGRVELRLSASGRALVQRSREVIERVLRSGKVVYGVNTGFGKLAQERIPEADLARLQLNLLRSHACGVGDPLPPEMVRAILLLRIRVLAQGYSGVRPELLERMIAVFNADLLAVVPEKGSVGASGDLAPLAHLALPLIGEGQVVFRGRVMRSAKALAGARLEPLDLLPKEGLALINGTQVTCALGAEALIRAEGLARAADLICALSLEAFHGTDQAFAAPIHAVRRQRGQRLVAANLRRLLRGSAILRSHRDCGKVQDPYSLRCAPQVHGTTRDSLAEARRVYVAELNAVTDNPLVFVDGDRVISGGNFHAQPVASAADRIAAAVTDLAAISERRTENLVNPDLSGLPAFLSPTPGLCSGFMILQVTAAALVSECKSLCYPASVDSIPTSGNKEDHVSMGPIAARKAREIVGNVERVLAIELLAACQGLEFEREYRSSRALHAVYRWVRRRIPPLTEDRSMSAEVEAAAGWIRDGELLRAAERAGAGIA